MTSAPLPGALLTGAPLNGVRGGPSVRRAPAPAVVPYVHPADDPALWRALLELGSAPAFVVVNVHDGPGIAPDAAYAQIIPSLLAAGVPLDGYVDTGYGTVPVDVAVEQVHRWRSRYGVSGVFLDQVVSAPTVALTELCARLRGLGVERTVLNPGTVTAPEVMALGEAVCTYEGPWADYRTLRPRRHGPADPRVTHLVHSVQPGDVESVVAQATRLGAANLSVGAPRGTSTWGRVRWPSRLSVTEHPAS